jgi:two-component system chemotaxis sensor kinase CheA
MPAREVLLIEDDEDIRYALHCALEAEGYEVISAGNGREGLEVLRSRQDVALVLLDLRMPVMNGEEFIDAVKEDERLRKLPLIVVSANATGNSIRGAAQIIRKPFDLDYLFASIRRASA